MFVECHAASDALWDKLLALGCRPVAAVELLLGLFTQAVLLLFLALLLAPFLASAGAAIRDRRAP